VPDPTRPDAPRLPVVPAGPIAPATKAELLKPALLGLDRERLRELLAPHVEWAFRADQVFDALHGQGVESLEDITTLSKRLRTDLGEHFRLGAPTVTRRHEAADGTVKFLFTLRDGATIEAVDIPEDDRRTLCLSSQAGCALGCTFCVTGFWGAGRNLEPGEIVGQWLAVRRSWLEEPRRVNLVFMGMGEPLLNPDNVHTALTVFGEFFSWRRMTLSTAGVIPGIEAMGRWSERPNLAISLHAPDDARRSEVMPINRSHPLPELMAALRDYPLEKGRRITFEYILIRDFNDAPADADALAKLLSGLRAKVNLIPINPDPVLGTHMVPPADGTVEAFRRRLKQRGLVATVRRRRGDDVSAACGQLRAGEREPRGALAKKRRREEAAGRNSQSAGRRHR
jgi:23S rRNA (adenine2503-C2)-methyltransferase